MERYINKDALKLEIEKRIKKYATIDVGNSIELDALYGAKCHALKSILSFLDTLEVKKVDLEQETQRILDEHFFYPEEDDELKETPKLARYIAKHFFELGLKAQKGE